MGFVASWKGLFRQQCFEIVELYRSRYAIERHCDFLRLRLPCRIVHRKIDDWPWSTMRQTT